MKSYIVYATFAFLFGCATGETEVNGCLLSGTSYAFDYQEVNGTCGPINSVIVNVTADGTIPTNDIECDSIESFDCTQNNTNCRSTSANGVDITTTSHLTFSTEGGEGYMTLSLQKDNSTCESTYKVTVTKL